MCVDVLLMYVHVLLMCVDVLLLYVDVLLLQVETGDAYPQRWPPRHHGRSDVPCPLWQKTAFISGS